MNFSFLSRVSLLLFLPGLLTIFVAAQTPEIRINELLAANDTTNPDNTDFDDYADWIELHNTTNQSQSLDGYYLTDDQTLPARWAFPLGAVIPANGYLLVWADGFDAGPGERHVRTASPWDRFTTQRYHTNFKLGSTGESVALNKVEGGIEQLSFISLGAVWQYHDMGTDPGDAWESIAFDDSAWSAGPAQLGYGENDQQTTIDFGSDDNNKYAAYYFRHTFSIDDTAGMSGVNLRLLADDGAVVYLNGEEVARFRMPDGKPTYQDYAADDANEDAFDEITLSADQFQSGENLLAVEVHQGDGRSSDVSFDLELTTTRIAGPIVPVDSVTFGVQREDISYGRDAFDPEKWVMFGEPTPAAANTTIPTLDPTPSTDTEFSLEGGFYTGNQQVILSTASGNATIRFTLDGSKPSSVSPAYESPLLVDETTVVRARTFESNKVPGKMVTQTYFIDEPTRDLPVVSFVVEPETFFDNELGIYRNIYKDREAPVSLEYFDGEQQLAFKVNAGAKIGGENIWRFAQKPLNIAMRGKYGDDVISYKIFPDEPGGTFDAIGFRNGGDNWPNAMLRDPMAPSIVRGQMQNDVGAYRPCVLYMNGEYWGIHNLRERHGDTYFFNHYHINAGEYDLLVKEHTINGTELVVKEGTDDAYNGFETSVTSTDLTDDANYEALIEEMDVDSLIDYVALVDFVYESSWHHNQEFWRERKTGAKWHWTINDIDRGFNRNNVGSSLIDDMLDRHPIFEALAVNTRFKNRFVQRYAAHISSTYHPDRIAEIVDRLSEEVDPEIQRHIDRWESEGGIDSIASRRDELDEIKQFAIDRLDEVYDDTASNLDINSDTATLTINMSAPDAGRILINGVPILPQYSNQVRLFEGIAFDLTAEAAPGFEFEAWSEGGNSGTLSRTLTGDSTITANFRRSSESLIPSAITTNTTLTTNESPYTAAGDITVTAGQTLSIEPGVVIRMSDGASLNVNGALHINGTQEAPVLFEPRNEMGSWGALAFINATGTSTLSHFKLVGASFSHNDPVNLKAAVSGFHSTIIIENAEIFAPFPIFARGGETTLRSSLIHPEYTGDGINIKDGAGLVEDCTFVGNESPDTDAIDFDNVVDGVIQRNRIFGFRGFNSDAIDIGEGCVNLLLSENRIYNSSDKGISVGQGSETIIRRNLIVGCTLGVGIKDSGSRAIIDQNTFVGNATGVAVYEKNLDQGGGEAVISNTLFSRSKDAPVTMDTFSSLMTSYSLSDTLPLDGIGNIEADPLFSDPGSYDFSLLLESPAINSGDPGDPTDPDGTRVDIGAYYIYNPDDYPLRVPNVVVINEVLSHSHNDAPDWIELHNTSNELVDIGGWFLSDSASDLQKFRIPLGTTLLPNGFLVFYENETFGEESTSPDRLTPFALSENGESVYLFGPGDGSVLDYLEKESFGPSPTGVSKGRYLKSTNTYNFVSMFNPTPGTANSAPLVGPVIITEIMYKPKENGDAEYVELTNISGEPVVLYDELKGEPWRFTNGIEFSFPTSSPVIMAPGERIVLVRNASAFRAEFTVPDEGTQVLQWSAGGLNNGGEQIEISSPGDVDVNGIRQWYRIDRVNYSDAAPWPVEADGDGKSLTRVSDNAYGNDVINWEAAEPTPGAPGKDPSAGGFENWAIEQNLPAGQNSFTDDADSDGTANGIEFAFGTDPMRTDTVPGPSFLMNQGNLTIEYPIAAIAIDINITIQVSPDLETDNWLPLDSEWLSAGTDGWVLRAISPDTETQNYFRVLVTNED